MKTNTRNHLRLGIFVTLSIFILITGIYFIGSRQQLFGGNIRVHIIFQNISGLQVGNNVRFSGIDVGTVENISQITDSTVLVDILINSKSAKFIRRDAVAMVGSDGLMGSKIIVISAGAGSLPVISDEDFIVSGSPVDFDDILINMKKTSENAALITENLAVITTSISEGKGTIGMLMMDTTFANNLAIAVANIRDGAGGFKDNMDKAGNSFLLKDRGKKNK